MEERATDGNVAEVTTYPAELLFGAVRRLMRELLKTLMKDAEIATELNVTPAQAKAWLQRLVDEGVVQKSRKSVGYIVTLRTHNQ